jgi:WD40 repeat protein/nucleoside phosphorylase
MARHRFDVLILTALYEDELEAVLEFGKPGREAWTRAEDSHQFPYFHRELPCEGGGVLRVAAASVDAMGETRTAGRAGALVEQLSPACLAMCGICAGKKGAVALGDVIVADLVYPYDEGAQSKDQFFQDLATYNLKPQWKAQVRPFLGDSRAWLEALAQGRPVSLESQERWFLSALLAHELKGAPAPDVHPDRLKRCPDFPKVWDRLQKDKQWLVETPGELALTPEGKGQARTLARKYPEGPPGDPIFQVHLAPIATGKALQKNPTLFDRLKSAGRRTLGAEMEAAAIGAVAEQLGRQAIIVKAVTDYGDADKDDGFRKFAARASAEVLLRFLARHLKPSEDELADEKGESGRNEREDFAFPGRGAGRRDDLLARVKVIVEHRHENPTITRIKAEPPIDAYLRVTPGGRFEGEYLIGAVEQFTPEALELFLKDVGSRYPQGHAAQRSTLISGDAPPAEAVTRAGAKQVELQSFLTYQCLIDFGSYLELQRDRLAKDPVYPHRLYIPQHTDLAGERGTANALETLSTLLHSTHGRFVLVLGDFGTGKTFLLRELARKLALGPLIPVLVELRSLQKAQQLDQLIALHLSGNGVRKFDLDAFRYMLRHGRIVLLFDGFDELHLRVGSTDRIVDHFATLLEAAQGDAKVVVTSRTQHFVSEKQVELVLARMAKTVAGHHRMMLQPFDEAQIQVFLRNRLDSDAAAAERFSLIKEIEDLLGLSANPRMLGFIADIPGEELKAVKRREGTVTAAVLYRVILTRWLEGEYERVTTKGALPVLEVAHRWRAVTDVALWCWRNPERELTLVDFPGETVEAVKALAHENLDTEEIKHQITSGTLLVRQDEQYEFIHRSVMEWLVAQEAAKQLEQGGAVPLFGEREVSRLMAEFFWGLTGKEKAERWAQEAVAGGSATLRDSALRVLKRLGVEAKEPLKYAGEDLSGRDFSGKNLRYSDFTGATLNGAVFVGADLTGARLAGAQLQRADLKDATLEGADLEGADLLAARLTGVRALKAKISGARFRGTQLIGARLDVGALDQCEHLGAALPDSARTAMPMVSAATWCSAVSFSPDQRLLATAHDGTIRLWDVKTGTELRVLQGHTGWVRSVAFNHDGSLLASGSDDTTVRLWDPLNGFERRVLEGHSQRVWSVAFNHDGSLLASGSEDTTVRLWDLLNGAEPRVLKGHSQSVWSVAFSHDGSLLASGSFDTTVRLWDPRSGIERRVLKGHSQSVLSVAFNHDGSLLASGSDDTTVRLWGLLSGAEPRVLKGHSQSVWSVAFNHDGSLLASGSDGATVRIWDPLSGIERRVLSGHSQSVQSVAFNHDGSVLASGSYDTTVRLWDPLSGIERRVLKGHSQSVLSIAFHHDGFLLASGSYDTTVRLWDLLNGAERRVLKGHSQSVWSVAFNHDSSLLASGSEDASVRLWDPLDGFERRVLKGHSQRVLSIAFNHDGSVLASGSDDTTVRLWNPFNGAERRVLKGHSKSVWSVAFNHDGSLLASGSEDTTVRLWEPHNGIERRVLRGHSQRVWSVAFNHDGALLASGSSDTTVRLWDPLSGIECRVLRGHSQRVWSVAFNHDGSVLASGSSDTTVRLWDPLSGIEHRVLKGHSQRVQSVAFNHDGSLLASSSTDGTVRIWEVDSGKCLVVLVSLDEGWVAFSPDGRYRSSGVIRGAFWHAIGLCRFEPGELDPYLPVPLRIPDGEPLPWLQRQKG